jgi:hypothetical protein
MTEQKKIESRPTIELTLPFSGKVAVVKEWITGREKEYIERPSMQSVGMRPDIKGGVEFSDINVEKIEETTHRGIETIVVSIDGKEDNILETVLEMHVKDYNTIVAYCQEMIKKN